MNHSHCTGLRGESSPKKETKRKLNLFVYLNRLWKTHIQITFDLFYSRTSIRSFEYVLKLKSSVIVPKTFVVVEFLDFLIFFSLHTQWTSFCGTQLNQFINDSELVR